MFRPFLPRIPGHEGIGEVVELGSNAKDYVKTGDIIGIPWIHQTCLRCEYCLTGREEFCLKLVRSGVTVDGCFAEYVLMNAHFAVKLPADMDPYTSAPIYCAGVTMYKALKLSKVRPGGWVSIVGIGGLGTSWWMHLNDWKTHLYAFRFNGNQIRRCYGIEGRRSGGTERSSKY